MEKAFSALREKLSPEVFIIPESGDYYHDETYLDGRAGGVLFPRNHGEIMSIMSLLHLFAEKNGAAHCCPVTIRGLGSGLSAGAVPEGGIVLSLEKMNRILELDLGSRLLRVEAGVTPDQIEKFMAPHGFMYAPDPSSFDISSIGGNIAANAAGPRSFRYGATREHIAALKVVWANGEEDILGAFTRKSAVGFDLKNLLIGSEGRLGIITEAWLKLVPKPAGSLLMMAGFDSVDEAVTAVLGLTAMNLDISAMEFIDHNSIAVTEEKWPGEIRGRRAGVLLEMEGDPDCLYAQLEKVNDIIPMEKIFAARDERSTRNIWEARREVPVAFRKKFKHKIGEDISLPVPRLPEAVGKIYNIGEQHGLYTVLWGHIGDGNLHVNFLFNEPEAFSRLGVAMENLANYVISLNGSISGEHALGRLKRHLRTKQHSGRIISLEEEIKRIFDPYNVLNPFITLPMDYSVRSKI